MLTDAILRIAAQELHEPRIHLFIAALETINAEVFRVCHVLIIEDEPLIAMDLQSLLEAEGAKSFDIAHTEEDAIALALKQKPDIITSDVQLLRGTGPRAVEKIHGHFGAIPVIFITGTPEDCKPCDPPGVVLGKPINARAVVAAFHRMQA